MAFPTFANSARSKAPLGLIGSCLRDYGAEPITALNSNDILPEVWTTTVSGTTASQAYAFSITDDLTGETLYSFSDSVEASDTTAALQASRLAELWNNSAGSNYATLAASSAVLTMTGRQSTGAFTLVESDSNLSTPSNTQNWGEATAIRAGRLLIDESAAAEGIRRICDVPLASDFTAQVMTLTITTASGAVYIGWVKVNGQTINWGPVAHSSDLDTTAAAIASAIETAVNAAGAGYTVVAASVGSSSGQITLTADVAGAEFDAWIEETTATGSTSATQAYTTGPSSATSLSRRLLGIAVRTDHMRARQSGGDLDDLVPVYRSGQPVTVRRRGVFVVQSSQSPSPGDAVWVSVASGSEGRVYTAGAANYIYLSPDKVKWYGDEPSTQAFGTALLELTL